MSGEEGLCYKVSNSIHGGPTLMNLSPPEVPLHDTITLGVRI